MDEAMRQINKIIFVCTGNTCRSPMAEIFYRSMEINEGIAAASRGLVVHFPEPINPKAVTVLVNHGLQADSHISRAFKGTELDEHTLVLTMTENQRKKLDDEHGAAFRIFALKEYAGENGDVVDPYGGTIMDYEECFGEISRLVRKAAYRVIRENETAQNEGKKGSLQEGSLQEGSLQDPKAE